VSKRFRLLDLVGMMVLTMLVSPRLPLEAQQAVTAAKSEFFTLQATAVADTVRFGSPILVRLFMLPLMSRGQLLVIRAHRKRSYA